MASKRWEKLRDSLHVNARNNGQRSHDYRTNCETTSDDFHAYLKRNDISLKRAEDVKNRHVIGYKDELVEAGYAPGTIANRLSHLRRVCPNFSLDNKELNLPERDRSGTHRAACREWYESEIEKIPHEGVRHTLYMSLEFQYRVEEAVMAAAHVKEIRTRLERGETSVPLLDSSPKGGRERWITVADPERALATVRAAEDYLERTGQTHFIPGGNVDSAKNILYGHVRRHTNMKGEHSPHSMRYLASQELYQRKIEDGASERGAVEWVSTSLGHGRERGYGLWRRVYSRR